MFGCQGGETLRIHKNVYVLIMKKLNSQAFKKYAVNLKRLFIAVVLSEGLCFTGSFGQKQSESGQNSYAVPTFECAGLYWKSGEDGACHIRYKEKTETLWKRGLDLIYDVRDREYRGSIVGLRLNKEYQDKLFNNTSETSLDFTT
jgi:hypothetical protein